MSLVVFQRLHFGRFFDFDHFVQVNFGGGES
jgi:hypothetical protein